MYAVWQKKVLESTLFPPLRSSHFQLIVGRNKPETFMLKSFRNTGLYFILTGIVLISTACTSRTQSPTPPPIPAPTSTPGPVPAEQGIYGSWSGMDNNNEVIIFFDVNGKVTLSYLGALHGGTFTLNEQTTPMQLDFVWDDIGTVLTILEFVDADTIRFENNYPSMERSTTFSDFVTLKRTR
jgi:hypothetical protein